MLHSVKSFVKAIFRPLYDILAKPLHRRVLQEVEAEIQQIHQHYLEFQTQYYQKVNEELVSLNKKIEELQHDRLIEQGPQENE
jgi:tryptophanyl-tRNA synthetase